MTPQIILVLSILVVAVVLFVTERIRLDLVALLVLGALALTGLVTPAEALSGFSNPAVVTVWAVFILSGALFRTGVANVIGRQVFRLAGENEIRLLAVIMLTAGVMSALMNNVGVAALLLPVVMDISRQAGHPPSRLLMPLAFGSLLGGLTTLIGTPPNILISDALAENGLEPFGLFDYTPVGVVILVVGVAFMALAGRYLLPVRTLTRESLGPGRKDFREIYDLGRRLFVIKVQSDSALVGKALAESRLGSVLGLNVIAIMREGETQLAPEPRVVLWAGDRLLVEGEPDRLVGLQGRQHLILETERLQMEQLVSADTDLAEAGLSPHSGLLGMTLLQAEFRQRYGLTVLAIWREGVSIRRRLESQTLHPGDVLLVQGARRRIEELRADPDFLVSAAERTELYRLDEHLLAVAVPADSSLAGRTLAESRLSDAFGLTALGVIRGGTTHLTPSADTRLEAGDTLLVKGDPESLVTLRGLQELKIDRQQAAELRDLESDRVGLSEVILSPHTTLAGSTLRGMHFREKYGLSVLAVWREGKAHTTDIRDLPLRLGDALLVHGPRQKLNLLGSEPDFVVLTESAQEEVRLEMAPRAILIMAGVLLPVMLGWLHISIAAVVGASIMILSGCLTMEEAYRFIEWKAVFLIAGMLPMGIAMENTGAARFLSEQMVALIGSYGPLAVIAGLYLLTALATQVMPNPAVAVLMAPIALSTASSMGVSPYTLMMAVALAASASFLSPIAHPANVLIMGPGGYRFVDYIRVGGPLTLVVLIVTLLVLPVFWPL